LKSTFEIRDESIIAQVLSEAEYGTLAISKDDRPYSLPINFTQLNDAIYFHGSKAGRKIDILKENAFASFSVVESFSMIQSYFSSSDNLACPATHFFKSIIIDGNIKFVEDYDEKVEALSSLMEKLQPEGRYKPLHEDIYNKAINATTIYKLIPKETKAKFKFGQHLEPKRFDMIIKHLEQRGLDRDLATIKLMKELKP